MLFRTAEVLNGVKGLGPGRFVVSSLLLRRLPAAESALSRAGAHMEVLEQRLHSNRGFSAVMGGLAAVHMGLAHHANSWTWRRALDALFAAAVMGGAFVVPVAGVVALVSLWLPPSTPLHRIGGQIFGIAILWFVASVLVVHLHPRRLDEEKSAG
jgi:hypothetical protein